MSALTPSSLPAPPITRTCRQLPCSRPAPSAQPVKAPAPRPRSGIAGLPAHGLWPELTVATGSSRSSFVHTAPGYLCPCRRSQAVKPLWFGRTLTQYLVTLPRTKRRAELLAPCGISSHASQLASYALTFQSWCACAPFPSYAQASLRINK